MSTAVTGQPAGNAQPIVHGWTHDATGQVTQYTSPAGRVDAVLDVLQQPRRLHDVDPGITELLQIGRFDAATELLHHRVQPVTDAQQRYVQFVNDLRRLWAVGGVDGLRAAR